MLSISILLFIPKSGTKHSHSYRLNFNVEKGLGVVFVRIKLGRTSLHGTIYEWILFFPKCPRVNLPAFSVSVYDVEAKIVFVAVVL